MLVYSIETIKIDCLSQMLDTSQGMNLRRTNPSTGSKDQTFVRARVFNYIDYTYDVDSHRFFLYTIFIFVNTINTTNRQLVLVQQRI